MSDLVTIVVPVYNTEKYLHRCLDSIAGQDYKDIEVLIVDDGSTDSSGRMCDDYILNDHRFHIIHQENHGQWSARNSALRMAKGKYIAFVDSDDYLNPNAVSVLCAMMCDGYDIAMIGFEVVREGEDHSWAIGEEDRVTVSGQDLIRMMILGNEHEMIAGASVVTKMYSRLLFSDLEFENYYAMEDWVYNFHAIRRVEHVLYDRRKLYYYTLRQGSTMHDISSTHKRLYFTFKGLIESFRSLSETEKENRAWLLISIYNKFISRSYLLKNTEYLEILQSLFEQFYLDTKREFYTNTFIPLRNKLFFGTVMIFPSLGNLFMKLKSGN